MAAVTTTAAGAGAGVMLQHQHQHFNHSSNDAVIIKTRLQQRAEVVGDASRRRPATPYNNTNTKTNTNNNNNNKL